MMKYTHAKVSKYMWLVALFLFISCVDSRYDLGDLNTDDLTVGKEWSIPLGTGVIKVNDVIDLDQITELDTTELGDYYMRFEGEVKVPFQIPELPSIPNFNNSWMPEGGIALPGFCFSIDGLDEMFPENFVLGLQYPTFTIDADVEGDGKIEGSLKLKGSQGAYGSPPVESVFTIASDFALESPSYSATISKDIDQLIEGTPRQIDVAATIKSIGSGITALKSFKYILDLPFIPSARFRAMSTETIKNAFDETLVVYLFSSGTTTIYGTFNNEFPFNIDVKMYITDAAGKRLDIDLPPQQVVGKGPKEVSFAFQSKDLPKMKDARNIELELALSGRPKDDTTQVTGEYLNKNQKVTMALQLKTSGGIKL